MAEKHLTTHGVNFTPLFQEETAERGGAAVMRMVLGSDKVGLSPLPTQQSLYNDAHGLNDGMEPSGTWDIDPQGLRESLMHLKPSTFTNIFVNYNFPAAQQSQANAKIVYTIDHYEVAPAVLVATGAQWVAVVGYRTDMGGTLETVFLNDARPPISSGTGDPPDWAVSASDWNTTANYFRPVGAGTRWNNQFAMVCDPDPPKGELLAAKERPRAEGRQLISADQAIRLTQQVLEERGLLEREFFVRAIRNGTPIKPQLVQIGDRDDQFYYLLRYQIEGRDAAVVVLDARFGTFHEAIAYPQPLNFIRVTPHDIPELLTKGLTIEERLEDVRERITNRLIQFVDPRLPGATPGWDMQRLRPMLETELARLRQPIKHLELRPEEISVHPLMVWQPSGQSHSMLYPFYLVNTPKQRIYVRAADGKIFTALDPLFWQRLGS